jgi:uncharacterized repeat protein (TIGR01451 family)
MEATRRRSPRGNRLLSVTVANVQAGKGYNRHGGWTLLVVWQSPSAPWRNVTLFDGFAFVQVQGGEQLVVGPLDFTGFETPASGDVDAHVTSWTYEGDRAITGDYMALGGVNSSCADLKHLSDAVNPVNNFFNSTISRAGVTVGGRAPGYDNQMGFDLDALAVPEGTIPNAATGASVCLGTVGDTYFFGGIAFDTLIRAPNLKIAKVADPTQANPGDTVTYTTEVSNPQRPAGEEPTSAATNLVVADPLPAGLNFVGFATNPGNACGYEATTRTIRCTKDRLDPDETFTYAYRARVSAAAQGDAPATLRNVACFESNSEDRPHDVYYGCDPATVIVPPVVPPPPTADLGVVKTVSHAVVAPGDTVTWRVVGTNYGPATSTGFVLADQLPGRIAFVSATPSPGLTCTTPAVGAAGAVRCSAPSVPAGSSLSVTITGRVPPGTPNGAVLRNVATVNGDQAEPLPDPHPNRDYTLTRVLVPDRPQPPPHPPIVPDPIGPVEPPVVTPPAPAVPGGLAGTRLRLRKRATPAHVARGDRVTFRLRVSNVGEAQARKVRVCDVLPRGLALVSASHFRVKGRVLCAYPGRIGVGASRGYRITARATGGARVVNRAAVRSADAPVARARAAVRVIAPRFTG